MKLIVGESIEIKKLQKNFTKVCLYLKLYGQIRYLPAIML